jgi:hypothetical protein
MFILIHYSAILLRTEAFLRSALLVNIATYKKNCKSKYFLFFGTNSVFIDFNAGLTYLVQ